MEVDVTVRRVLPIIGAAALTLGTVAAAAAAPEQWIQRWRHAPGVIDVAGPRSDGRLVVTAAGRLWLLRAGGRLEAYARGPGGYVLPDAGEPYLTVVPQTRRAGAGCQFTRDDVYGLDPTANPPGIVRVDSKGRASRLVDLPGIGLLAGITIDGVGRFKHRLLVLGRGAQTTVVAIDCSGKVETITATAPLVEGGIAVAPRGFGSFSGQLIAADEGTGRILAINSTGATVTVAESGLPAGPDIGVESVGFVPAGLVSAYVADHGAPGSTPRVGTDSILRLPPRALRAAGVLAGDLLVATETGARTIAVRCRTTCSVREVATGPPIAHIEGQISFAPATGRPTG